MNALNADDPGELPDITEIVVENRETFELIADSDSEFTDFAERMLREADDE